MAMMNKLVIGSAKGVISVPYAHCETVAATAAKVVAFTDFALETGVVIRVTFKYDNTAAAPKLNVNSTGEKSIYYDGAVYKDLFTNHVYDFMYNGSQWVVLNPPLVWHTF